MKRRDFLNAVAVISAVSALIGRRYGQLAGFVQQLPNTRIWLIKLQ